MSIVFVLIALVYIIFTGMLWCYWLQVPSYTGAKTEHLQTYVSVIIPVRNEEKSIGLLLQDLQNQSYASTHFEVLVVDDASTDATLSVLTTFEASFPLHVLSLNADENLSHKKQAISLAMTQAKGSLIACTDGDCRVGEKWLESIVGFYIQTNARFIMAGVTFHHEQTLFEHMQTIEFAALTASGAACLQAGFPNMSNGANLAYEKSLFMEVNGYKGFEHLASGDDEFLMHKAFMLDKHAVKFLKNPEAVVRTSAKASVAEFVQQRKRWAGKWKHYQLPHVKYIAMGVFLGNLNFILWISYALWWDCSLLIIALSCFAIKTALDLGFLSDVLGFYKKRVHYLIFALTSIFYPFYVSFFALMSNKRGFVWKGRKHR